jgi:hypothetical protein
VLTSGQDNGSRTVVLPFRPGSRQPAAVLKVSAHAHLNANTAHEQAALAELHQLLDTALKPTIPQPLGLQRLGQMTVSMESCAPGHTLVVSSGRWPAQFTRQRDDLRLAAHWLAEFHRQTQTGGGRWDPPAHERWIAGPLEAYGATFGVTPDEAGLFNRVEAQSQALCGAILPMVRIHYDFGPWNLYRHHTAFTVIDWEFGRTAQPDHQGPALYDLLYFVTYWHHVVHHLHTEAAELDGLYRLFVAPASGDRHVAAAHAAIADYLAALGINPRFVPVMLVCLWVEQALHRFARRQTLGDVPADARAGNRCIRYLGVLAAHTDELFARPAAPASLSQWERSPARDV